MHDKIVKFEINPQNKQLIDLQITSPNLQNICWKTTKIELIIDLNHMAFRHVDGLNVSLFCWLKSKAVNVSLSIKNLPEDIQSQPANISFFESCLIRVESLKLLKCLKIIVPQINIFNGCNFAGLAQMSNLTILDLSSFNIQRDSDNKYLTPIIDFINSIEHKSNIIKILLPLSIRNQELNVENDDSANQLFIAIQYALSVSSKTIEISPTPMFFGLQYDIAVIMNQKQGAQLEEWYNEHDRDYETMRQLKIIPHPTPDITAFLANISNKFNKMFKNIEDFYPIIDTMNPKYLYWLDKILREKMHNPDHILSCLKAVKLYDNCQDILFDILQGLVSDVVASRFREVDINSKELTYFICADKPTDKADIIKTLLKIHLEFDVSKDNFLSKILSNMIEEFVFGNGIQTSNHLVSIQELEDPSWFLVKLLKEVASLHLNKQLDDILKDEKYFRLVINKEQIEDQFNLFTSFSYKHSMRSKYTSELSKNSIVPIASMVPIDFSIKMDKKFDDTEVEQVVINRDTPRCSNGS